MEDMDVVVTVDAGECTLYFALLFDSDLDCFQDGESLLVVEEDVRLLGGPTFESFLGELRRVSFFTTTTVADP